jgi:hypothetical protein
MKSGEAKRLLSRAWALRGEQRNEECLALWPALRAGLEIPAEVTAEWITHSLSREDSAEVLEALALEASLLRARKRLAASDLRLDLLDGVLRECGRTGFFQIHFQRGLNCLTRGDYVNALEQFLAASRRAETAHDKIFAESNALFCMDDLGLPCRDALARVEELLGSVAETPGLPGALSGARAQVRHFHHRIAFRNGELAGIFPSRASGGELNQCDYFRFWVGRLPYHSFHGADASALVEFLQSPPSFFEKSYRKFTLQGICGDREPGRVKPSELADRIYLWTWNWMAAPESFPVLRLATAIAELSALGNWHHFTAEDSQLLRNALLWLGLFDPDAERQLEKRLHGLPSAVERAPLLELERGAIAYLSALHRGDSEEAERRYAICVSHPLWSAPAIGFRELVAAVREGDPSLSSPALRKLARSLVDLLARGKDIRREPIVIDPAVNEIHNRLTGDRVVNEGICRAMELLRRSSVTPLEALSSACFGIEDFDSLTHAHRVFRLLARMRRALSPVLEFRTKTGFVIAEGDWSKIAFLSRCAERHALSEQAEWKAFLRGAEEIRPAARSAESKTRAEESSPPAPIPEVVSRKELERITGRSRASVNRVLQRWEQQGWVKKEGRARATRYWLSRKLRARIESEGEVVCG